MERKIHKPKNTEEAENEGVEEEKRGWREKGMRKRSRREEKKET